MVLNLDLERDKLLLDGKHCVAKEPVASLECTVGGIQDSYQRNQNENASLKLLEDPLPIVLNGFLQLYPRAPRRLTLVGSWPSSSTSATVFDVPINIYITACLPSITVASWHYKP